MSTSTLTARERLAKLLPFGNLEIADKLLDPISPLPPSPQRQRAKLLPFGNLEIVDKLLDPISPLPPPRAFNHIHVNAVLAAHDTSYTLTNGVVSYSEDENPNWMLQLYNDVQTLKIQRLYVVDQESRNQWRSLQKYIPAAKNHQEILLIPNELTPLTVCKQCLKHKCHRWAAVFEMRRLMNRYPINQIPHS